MKNILILALIMSIYSYPPPGYKLIWSDEFNGNSIDRSKWGFEYGGEGWGNNELQHYTDRGDNAYVYDGVLHIRAKKEYYNGNYYTSARMVTKGKFDFKYGYVEASIALPRGNGIWPAFWMLGNNIDSVGWPSCGEIDILEAVNKENKIYSTCHWNANGGHAQYGKNSEYFDITQFHVYQLWWDSEHIKAGVDGKVFYDILIKDGTGGTSSLHNRFYLLLNVAVGGSWPGYNIDDNQFPNEMKVDYIRVYQP